MPFIWRFYPFQKPFSRSNKLNNFGQKQVTNSVKDFIKVNKPDKAVIKYLIIIINHVQYYIFSCFDKFCLCSAQFAHFIRYI